MHQVGFVVSPGFQLISLAALSVFEMANIASGDPLYDVRVLAERPGLVRAACRAACGVSLHAEALATLDFDTVMFAGGVQTRAFSRELLAFAQRSVAAARRVAAICTGAFVLAEAGILDGRKATTHWAAAQDLRRRFPQVTVDADRIFIADGAVWTSAGASAGIDLALEMVETDFGRDLAQQVARSLVVHHRRPGGQSQHSAMLELQGKSDRIQLALEFAGRNLGQPLQVDDLAAAANLSPRQFSRAFRAETGQSPAKAIEALRLEAARRLLEQTTHAVESIARQTGFADRERMRRAFVRAFGQPPRAFRRAFRPA